MNVDKLVRMDTIFRTFIIPLMDEEGANDLSLIWEFENYVDSKKDEIASSKKQAPRKWEALLQNK